MEISIIKGEFLNKIFCDKPMFKDSNGFIEFPEIFRGELKNDNYSKEISISNHSDEKNNKIFMNIKKAINKIETAIKNRDTLKLMISLTDGSLNRVGYISVDKNLCKHNLRFGFNKETEWPYDGPIEEDNCIEVSKSHYYLHENEYGSRVIAVTINDDNSEIVELKHSILTSSVTAIKELEPYEVGDEHWFRWFMTENLFDARNSHRLSNELSEEIKKKVKEFLETIILTL